MAKIVFKDCKKEMPAKMPMMKGMGMDRMKSPKRAMPKRVKKV